MNRKTKIIEHNLDFYRIEQDLFEPDELFYERANYITKNLDNDKLDNLIKLSRIISNTKNFNCEYNSNIIKMFDLD